MNDTTELNERRNLLRGPAWDAVIAAVIADEEMRVALEAERLLAAAA